MKHFLDQEGSKLIPIARYTSQWLRHMAVILVLTYPEKESTRK